MHRSLRLRLDRTALQSNWTWLQQRSGVTCGAAVKADGYGLGARAVTLALHAAGCRDFFVSTWDEAARLGALSDDSALSVLHGVGESDLADALASNARPVLNSPIQVARWKAAAPGRPCDVMVDTGMNRLGLRPEEAGLLDGLVIETLMSHLACADEDSLHNAVQRARFSSLVGTVKAKRYSLANSAGICLGRDYAYDLVRPGLALYGGLPRGEATGHIAQVAFPEAQVIQRRIVHAGETIGYGATFTARRDMAVAILNIGYADGYFRAFAASGAAVAGYKRLPLLGRVSMDLVAVAIGDADVAEGDWLGLECSLPGAAAATGLSQYELLTSLNDRFDRRWS